MAKIFLPKIDKKITTECTIGFDGDLYDELSKISEESGLNLNHLVNTCLRFAVKNIVLEDSDNK